MQLLPKYVVSTIPKLYEVENEADPLVRCKFFLPDSSWTWYVLEFDGEDNFFGYVVGAEPKLGYFSFKELKNARGALGLPIKRDFHFKPKRLPEVRKLHE